MAALLEDVLGVRLLKVSAADFLRGNVGCNGQNRHATALAIVEAVDEVQIAGPATSRADGQLSGQRGFGSGSEGSRLLMSHTHPLDAIAHPDRVGDAVERIARHAVDALYAGSRKNFNK